MQGNGLAFLALGLVLSTPVGSLWCQCELEGLIEGDLAIFPDSNSDVREGRIALGLPRDDTHGENFGEVFIFHRQGDKWEREELEVPPDLVEGSHFGSSVALGEGFVIIGADGDDDGGQDAGAVYVYTRGASVWTLDHKLVSPEARELNEFGKKIVLDGDRLFVGAPVLRGYVFYFERDGVTWKHRQTIGGIAGNSSFGEFMDADGRMLAITDRRDGGSVRVYGFTRGSWVQEDTLMPTGGKGGFGDAVAVQGNSIAVGQCRFFEPVHRLYLYTSENDSWNRETLLTRRNDYSIFASLAFHGDCLVLGDDGLPDQVDIFCRSGAGQPGSSSEPPGIWRHLAHIPEPGGEGNDFGNSVSMDSEYVVISSRLAPPLVWTLGESICCRPHFFPIGEGTLGSGGFVPELSGEGDECTIDSSLFRLQAGLGGAAGLFFLNFQQASVPFLGGHLYVDGPWYSFPLVLDGEVGMPGGGSAELPLPNIRSLVGIALYAQAAIMDVGAKEGVSLSNGLRLRVGPN